MNDNYYKPPRNPVAWGMLALLLGCMGTFIAFKTAMPMIATFLGAAGMMIGGFSINVAMHFPNTDKNKPSYIGFAAAGIMASVIAFMIGFMNWLG
jgi:hypothetical protein